MRSNLLKTNQPGIDSPATRQGPMPGNFVLGSAESRAAARAAVHRLTEKQSPQPGDIFVDLGSLGPKRAAEIYRVARNQRESTGTPDRIPGRSMMWLKLPKGLDPDSLPESTPPMTWHNAPVDLLKDFIRCCNEAFRNAKQSGQQLPPEFDPDLAWNGMAYVPGKRLKVTG